METTQPTYKPFRLSSMTRERIARTVGLSFDDICKMGTTDMNAYIERKIGKPLTYAYSVGNNHSMIGRGNVYLFLRRLFTIDKNGKMRDI